MCVPLWLTVCSALALALPCRACHCGSLCGLSLHCTALRRRWACVGYESLFFLVFFLLALLAMTFKKYVSR